MVTRKQSINNFSEKMDKLIDSSYLLTASRIKDVLKALTSSKLFFELITFCMQDFDFENIYSRYTESQKPYPTEDKKTLIAFGFSILAAIDSKELELLSVLSNNYKNDYVDRSYRNFAALFLTPFKLAIVEVAEQMLELSRPVEDSDAHSSLFTDENFGMEKSFSPEEHKASRELVYDENQPRRNYLTCYSDIQKIITEEKSKIIHGKIKENEKRDLFILLESFRDCLFKGSKEQVKTTFISYKYAILSFKRLQSDVEDIERILKFCNIL